MATTTVVPTHVRDRMDHSGADIVLAGNPNTMWGDGSDATYAYRDDSEPANAIILADVAAGQVPGAIVSATATMRVLLDAGNSDRRIDFWLDTLGSETPVLSGFAFAGADTFGSDPTATPGVTTTLTGILLMNNSSGHPMSAAALTSAFAAGFVVGVARRPAVGVAALTVYELTFTVNYTPAAPAGVYPFRRYPPVRNGGFGATRHWPKSMNRRPGTNT